MSQEKIYPVAELGLTIVISIVKAMRSFIKSRLSSQRNSGQSRRKELLSWHEPWEG